MRKVEEQDFRVPGKPRTARARTGSKRQPKPPPPPTYLKIALPIELQTESGFKLTPKRQRFFQRKLLASIAPVADPLFFESLLKGVVDGDSSAQRLYAEIRSYTSKSGGLNINTNINSNNYNSSKTISVAGGGFDSIVRALNEKRKQAGVSVLTLDATATPVVESGGDQ
jgi:hypothetical protein